ncbi:hypothetical protein [EBPR siphovirus 5]|nr:hypothetical protein [EBPR siphovirus 5]
MDFKTEHDGYEIRFYERDDSWSCLALGLSDRSLKGLKAKINKVTAQARRLDAVELIEIGHYLGARHVIGTLLDDGDTKVWVSAPGRGNSPPTREKCALSGLALNTPENGAKLAEAKKLSDQAEALTKEAQAIRAAIPRVTAEQLRALKNDESVS